MEWAQKWASSHSWGLLYYRGSTVGPKIGFVPNLLSRPIIMQGVKKKIIQVIQVLLYIYIKEIRPRLGLGLNGEITEG